MEDEVSPRLNEVIGGNSKKDSVVSKSSVKKVSKIPTLKKGIPSTASSITLPRAPMNDNVNTPKYQKINKPPLSK